VSARQRITCAGNPATRLLSCVRHRKVTTRRVGVRIIAGILADQTHSYRLGFVIIALLAGSGIAFFAPATPPAPPVREPELVSVATA